MFQSLVTIWTIMFTLPSQPVMNDTCVQMTSVKIACLMLFHASKIPLRSLKDDFDLKNSIKVHKRNCALFN